MFFSWRKQFFSVGGTTRAQSTKKKTCHFSKMDRKPTSEAITEPPSKKKKMSPKFLQTAEDVSFLKFRCSDKTPDSYGSTYSRASLDSMKRVLFAVDGTLKFSPIYGPDEKFPFIKTGCASFAIEPTGDSFALATEIQNAIEAHLCSSAQIESTSSFFSKNYISSTYDCKRSKGIAFEDSKIVVEKNEPGTRITGAEAKTLLKQNSKVRAFLQLSWLAHKDGKTSARIDVVKLIVDSSSSEGDEVSEEEFDELV